MFMCCWYKIALINNINYKSYFWPSRFNMCYCLILFRFLVFLLLLLSLKIKITNKILHISWFIAYFFTSWLNFQMKSWINMSFTNYFINLPSSWYYIPIVISYDWIIWYFLIAYFYRKFQFIIKISLCIFFSLLHCLYLIFFIIINFASQCSFFIISFTIWLFINSSG